MSLAVGPWDIAEFGREHLPAVVGRLEGPHTFGIRLARGPVRVLDMPIKFPEDEWAIPINVTFVVGDAIALAAEYENAIEPIEDKYVYITVDQKPVAPGTTQRREGWHSDAYLTDDHGRQYDITAPAEGPGDVERTYICYDRLATVFAPGPWALSAPNDCETVLREFAEQIDPVRAVVHEPYTVLGLDPYCVHNGAPNRSSVEIPRTFVKVQFSRRMYNRQGNTHNILLSYQWDMVPRDPERREHRWAK